MGAWVVANPCYSPPDKNKIIASRFNKRENFFLYYLLKC